MAAGIDALGLQIKTLEEIQNEIVADQQSLISAGIDASSDQILGQLNGITASKLAELWEGLQTAYNAFNPAAAEGTLLDTIGALRGVVRLGPTYSIVTLTCAFDAANVTLVSGVAFAAVAGQASNRWTPVTTFVSPSAGSFPVKFRAQSQGPIAAGVSSISVISTGIAGWLSVTNAAAPVKGNDTELDGAYRVRQASLLASPGASTVDAIRADLLRLVNMRQVIVNENTSATSSADGLAPHSFEALFFDNNLVSNVEIAQTIWNSKPAGIATSGNLTANATDSDGILRPVRFTRATPLSVRIDLFFTRLPGWLPAQSIPIIERINAYVAGMKIGEDLRANVIRALVMQEPFVWDVSQVLMQPIPGVNSSTVLSVGPRQYVAITTVDFYDAAILSVP